MTEYIAHIRASDGRIQTVEEHLLEVRHMAESFGEKLRVKHIAGLAGMLHDLGKYTNEFREYILEAVTNPDSPPKRGSVDHSTAGGKFLYQYFHTDNKPNFKSLLSEVVGNTIISHHAYLQDFLNPELESNYLKRVRDKELCEFENTKTFFFQKVISEPDFYEYVERAAVELEKFVMKKASGNMEKKVMFLTKFIFSTLIDADRTNTRTFEENKPDETATDRKGLFETYCEKLNDKIASLKNNRNAQTPINILRRTMSDQCDRFAVNPSGIYTLSIPTGGGKTLASLRYSLKHAIIHGKKQIIFVVPFTTIIEQNADEVRRILMDDRHILEHHSNVVDDSEDNDENMDGIMSVQQKLKYAKDNWDSPIIFTTMVQFLNVFYAKGSRNIRRLHNLLDSILVFDEVQKVPVSCVSLFNDALNFLNEYGNSSVLLCTATQPALDFVEHSLEIDTDAEIISNLDQVIKAFKRVEVIDRTNGTTVNNEQLAEFMMEKIQENQSILTILNTKTVVRNLYERLKTMIPDIPVYHLSTSMCAAHRNAILEEVREHLQQGHKIICVSTQLIEAGVDVSFECVIRSLAGLDSIAQAAGRCNRHGEMGIQSVYVIDHEEEKLDHLKEIKKGKEISKRILIDLREDKRNHGGDILSPQAMERYFKEYYTEFKTDLDFSIPKLGKNMTDLLAGPRKENSYRQSYYFNNDKEDVPLIIVNSYGTAAEHFHVIKNITTSAVVPYREGKDIITEFNSAKSIDDLGKLLKKAQQYTVNLFNYEKDKLAQNGGLVSFLDGKILALKEGAYNDEHGMDIKNESEFQSVIF